MITPNVAPPRSNLSGRRLSAAEVKTLAANRIPDILRDLCGVPSEAIQAAENGNSREFPCPKCGGRTRFRVTDLSVGRVFCSHCCRNKSEGCSDFLGAVKWRNDYSFPETLRAVADHLGFESATPFASTDRKSVAPSSSFAPAQKKAATNGGRTRTGGALAVPPDGSAKIATYDYRDESGAVRWRVRRTDVFDAKGERVERRFQQGRVVDGRFEKGLGGEKLPPYNLPRLLAPACRVVYVVEGEKCADALQEFFDEFINAKTTRKSVATTLGSSKNAKRWPEYAPRLSDKEIVVFADLDEPGEEAAQAAAKAFANVGASVDVVSFTRGENADGEPVDFERPNGEGAPPPTYDVADYLDDLRAETATLEPEKARAIRWSKFLNLLKTFSRPPKAVLPALPREFGFSVPVGRDVRAQQVDNDKFAPPSTTAPEPGTFDANSGDASSPRQEENDDAESPVERRKRRDAAARERRIEREIEEEAAPFPLDVLPRVLREYVEELARRLQCDPGPLALACLSVAGCVAGFRYRLYAPELIVGKQIRPQLSAMLVGTPGAGKTPITGAALAPLEEIDKEAIEKYNERPKGKRGLFVSHMMRDATPQAFQRRLIDLRNQGVQNGVLLYLQEGAKALNFDSRGNGAAATNSILIETLGGGQQRIDRVKDGDEALVADAVCCAVLAEIQPDPLRRAIQRDSSFADQGLAYRFLWAYVPDRPLAIEVAAPDETTRIAYVALIRWLDELFPEDEAEPGLTLVLSPEALDATKRFRAEINAEVERLNLHGSTFAAIYRKKTDNFLLPLALLFHVCDCFKPFVEVPCKATGKVGADAVERAARVVRWCWDSFDQCFRIARKESLNPFEQRTGPVAPERRTLDVIRDAGANGLTAAEITRKISMFNQKNGKKKRAKILNALVDQGLIEQFVDRSGKRAVQKFRTVELVEAEETTEDDEE